MLNWELVSREEVWGTEVDGKEYTLTFNFNANIDYRDIEITDAEGVLLTPGSDLYNQISESFEDRP